MKWCVMRWCVIWMTVMFCSSAGASNSSTTTNDILDSWIKRFDKEVVSKPGLWQMVYQNMAIYVISDNASNRMRILVEIADANQLEKEHLHRLMQANFDTAFDARYAIAQGSVWSAFVHPLSHLGEREFFSGLAQTVTLARTFGSTFSSGALTLDGGESQQEHEKLYQEILKKGLAL